MLVKVKDKKEEKKIPQNRKVFCVLRHICEEDKIKIKQKKTQKENISDHKEMKKLK